MCTLNDVSSCSSNDDTISQKTQSTSVSIMVEIDGSQSQHSRSSMALEKSGRLQRIFYLEPAIALVCFASSITSIVFHNYLRYLACRNVFQFAQEECEPLRGIVPYTNNSKEIYATVKPYAENINWTISLLETIIPAVLILLIGAWSDRYGRKPFVIITLMGFLVGYVVLSFLATIPAANPWLFVLGTVPSALAGGTCTLLSVSFSYITDAATPAAKGMRLVYHFTAISLGVNLGILVSGTVFAATNLPSLFAISMSSILLALLYAWNVPEVMQVEQATTATKARNMFRFDSLKDLYKTYSKHRPDENRTIIWLCLTTALISNIAQEGSSSVNYSFLNTAFGLGLSDYIQFTVISGGIQIIGGLTGMIVFRKLLRLTLVPRSLIALSSLIMQSIIICVASEWWQLYLGSSLGLLGGIIVPLLFAIISQVSPSEEAGKMFSFITALITLAPLAARPMYGAIFDAMADIFPGLFNVMSMGLYLSGFFLVCAIHLILFNLGSTLL